MQYDCFIGAKQHRSISAALRCIINVLIPASYRINFIRSYSSLNKGIPWKFFCRQIRCIFRNITYRQFRISNALDSVNFNWNRFISGTLHQQLNIRKLRRRLRTGHQNDILHRALHLIRSVVALILIALFQLHLIHPQISCGRQDLIQKSSLGLYTVYIGGNGIFLVYIEDLAVFHQVIHTVNRYHDVPIDFFVG